MRAIQDNVETGLLIGSWCCGCFELCSDQVTLIRRDVVIQKIRFIAFFASNVELGYEWVFIGRENGDMDMRRTPGVRHRSNGSKSI